MGYQSEELIATPLRERFRFENAGGDVVILEAHREGPGDDLDRIVSLKGPAEDDEPASDLTYRFYGHWSEYKGQPQFVFKTFVASAAPAGRNAIVAYLARAPRVGRALARALWTAFGENAVEALRTNPGSCARQIPRLHEDAASEAAEWLREHQKLEAVTIELTGLFEGRGFPRDLVRDVVKRWGNRAPERIRQNPYLLRQFHGVGFMRCDQLYLELGGNPARLKRQSLCAEHAIQNGASGDTWHWAEVARAAIRGSVGGAEVNPDRALRLATRGGLLVARYTDGQDGELDPLGDSMWLADHAKARAEAKLARLVREAREEPSSWADLFTNRDLGGLSEHQAEEAMKACGGTVGLLGGSPGTGKTYTLAQLVRMAGEVDGFGQVRIAAPTGKAAVRCGEALAEYGLPVRPQTIHSLLEVQSSEGGWAFNHHAGNPLECRWLFVDESSMIDTSLMCSLFKARGQGTHVLLVGDVRQLLPVGHGAPFRDFMAAGLPYGELREIRRNSGMIVEACAAIRDGQKFETAHPGSPVNDVDNLRVAGPDWPIEKLVGICAAKFELHPVWGVQVICAVNEKSDKSRVELNKQLQAALNPNPAEKHGRYRRDDKVICLKNGWCKLHGEPGEGARVNENGEVYVANGDMGRVESIGPKSMIVDVAAPARRVQVPLAADWDLAYAISVHKSQGSEFPCVIVALDDSPGADRLCDRAWVYTAISRAKKQCVLWGDVDRAYRWCQRDRIAKRKTFLKELLR